MNGGGAIVQRVDATTAAILTRGQLQLLNLADGEVNWTVQAEGRPVVSAESGAVLEVAPDGSTISRVVLTGEVLSRGQLRGNPAPSMRGFDVSTGEMLWESFGVEVTQLLTVNDVVLGVTSEAVVMVSLETGGVQTLLSLDEREVAPDAHSNICAYSGSSDGQPNLQEIRCVRPMDGAGRSLMLEGDRVEWADGVWLLHRDGELVVFQ